MPFLRRRRPDPSPGNHEGPVPDDEVAAAMLELAQAFVNSMAAEGETFTWDAAEVSRLDGLCGRFRSNADPEFRRLVGMTVGAYLGELMVRHGGARWTYDSRERAAVVEMPNGLRGYPHNKVGRRLEYGPRHSLLDFYWYSTTRELPPGPNCAPTANAAARAADGGWRSGGTDQAKLPMTGPPTEGARSDPPDVGVHGYSTRQDRSTVTLACPGRRRSRGDGIRGRDAVAACRP